MNTDEISHSEIVYVSGSSLDRFVIQAGLDWYTDDIHCSPTFELSIIRNGLHIGTDPVTFARRIKGDDEAGYLIHDIFDELLERLPELIEEIAAGYEEVRK